MTRDASGAFKKAVNSRINTLANNLNSIIRIKLETTHVEKCQIILVACHIVTLFFFFLTMSVSSAVTIFPSFPFTHVNNPVSPPEYADTVSYWCLFLGIDFMVFIKLRVLVGRKQIYTQQ